MLSMLLLVSAVAAAEPPQVTFYAGPIGGEAPLEQYEFLQIEPGTTVFAASDRIHLRAEPSTSGRVLGQVDLGTEVSVLDVATGPTAAARRVDQWYRVRTTAGGRVQEGFVFGGALTPLRFVDDFDQDGEMEVATVAVSWDHKVRLRVLEPAMTGTYRVAHLDLDAPYEFATPMLRAKAISATEAGLPLVWMNAVPEACGFSWFAYASYRVPDGARATRGELKVALQIGEVTDPPVFASSTVVFHPSAGRAVVTETITHEDENGDPLTTTSTASVQWREGILVAEPAQ